MHGQKEDSKNIREIDSKEHCLSLILFTEKCKAKIRREKEKLKQEIRLWSMNQWHLLNQLNPYLKKRKIPDEVMKKIRHILAVYKLKKNDFIIVCMKSVDDSVIGMAEVVGINPSRLLLSEQIEEIPIKNGHRKKHWYITQAEIKGAGIKIHIIYSIKNFD